MFHSFDVCLTNFQIGQWYHGCVLCMLCQTCRINKPVCTCRKLAPSLRQLCATRKRQIHALPFCYLGTSITPTTGTPCCCLHSIISTALCLLHGCVASSIACWPCHLQYHTVTAVNQLTSRFVMPHLCSQILHPVLAKLVCLDV